MNAFFKDLGFYTAMIAGAIFIGGILPTLKHWNRDRLPLVLSFAAGLMLGSVFFHLLPEAYHILGKNIGVFVLAGFLFLFFAEKYITLHICEIFDCEVHHLGVAAFIGIAVHTLANGIALGSSLMVPYLGVFVFLAVAAHKAPEAFSLTTVLLHTGAHRSKIILVNVLIILMIPAGALLAYGILEPGESAWTGRALAFSAGTFLHISLSDLLPEAHRHSKSKALTSLMLLLGLAVMWLLEYFFIPD